MSVLHLDHVTHRYRGSESPAVRDVSLRVTAGEVVALVGPNGSGKSTLLSIALSGQPTSGEVEWYGKLFSHWPRRELARRVAALAQSPSALPGQLVRDVLATGRSPYWSMFGAESLTDREAVAAVAETLGLTPWLSRPIETLSGGQRQRVFLGRCLVQLHGQASAALLLDEPDTFLDLARAGELGRLIRSLARDRGLAVLVASHDLNLAAGSADRIALLKAGELVATGPPAEVLSEANVEATYGAPVRRLDVDSRPVIVPR